MLEKGSTNTAAEQARTLAFDDVEAVLLGAEREIPTVSVKSGQTTGPVESRTKAADIDPEEAIARAAEKNSNGSLGRFMGMVHGLEQRGKLI